MTCCTSDIENIPAVQDASQVEWKQQFKEGQKLRARVTFVDPTAKSIHLSLLPYLLKMTPLNLPAIGSLIKVIPRQFFLVFPST